jgi:hypothetical protein
VDYKAYILDIKIYKLKKKKIGVTGGGRLKKGVVK